jgi:type IV fimbrial biogenesis protein FimT
MLGKQYGGRVLTQNPIRTAAWRRGVSLVELLVAIAVLAVILAAVTPSVSDVIANMRLRSVAESTMTGLQKARTEAIKSNQNVSFWLMSQNSAGVLDNSCATSATSAAWVVSYDDPSGACDSTPSTTDAPRIVQIGSAGAGASNVAVQALNSVALDAVQVSFNGFGRHTPATAASAISSIDFTSNISGVRRLRVEISAAGSVRICDRDVTVTTPPDPRACT